MQIVAELMSIREIKQTKRRGAQIRVHVIISYSLAVYLSSSAGLLFNYYFIFFKIHAMGAITYYARF